MFQQSLKSAIEEGNKTNFQYCKCLSGTHYNYNISLQIQLCTRVGKLYSNYEKQSHEGKFRKKYTFLSFLPCKNVPTLYEWTVPQQTDQSWSFITVQGQL